jgi:hypothetical protein
MQANTSKATPVGKREYLKPGGLADPDTAVKQIRTLWPVTASWEPVLAAWERAS